MTRNSQTFRIMLAISAALVLNVILFAEPFFHPHWQPGSSSAEKLMDSLSRPAGLFVDKFFPGQRRYSNCGPHLVLTSTLHPDLLGHPESVGRDPGHEDCSAPRTVERLRATGVSRWLRWRDDEF